MPSNKYTSNVSIKLTHLQQAILKTAPYKGNTGVIVRFLLNKLFNDELPASVKMELEREIGKQRTS